MEHTTTDLTIAVRRQLVLSNLSTVASISEATRLSFPTVKKQLEQLIQAGEVFEHGFEDSRGGRPAKRYVYNEQFTHGLTLYVEKTVIRYRLIDCTGKTIDDGTQLILDADHLGALGAVLDRQLDQTSDVSAISLGVAAAVADGTIILAPEYPTFAHLDLKRWVESRTDRPAVIENDMNAAVYGYGHTHELSGDQSIVYIYLGKNGPGAGILINGQLIRGKTGFSGEISFLPLYDDSTFLDRITSERSAPTPAPLSDAALDALGRLVATFTATLNPHAIIFSDVDLVDAELEGIRHACQRHIPAAHTPDLLIGIWEEDYFAGLARRCVGLILESI
ncbi:MULTISPECIES: ROK family transcriptional regulator [Exiguobacterium]|uniref:ROK family transcriptional regulator n=1 Tax=Exiguobacterium TaxID=33986 RepID=UPI001BE59198|nr:MULTISPECIES: ROK family protein [Exiguobacterium]MCT4776442.1 ROK family protein [Exiguobacterium aquaticum]MCT4788682.1 ROK family protein [Exiguobacterium mexicanum]